MKGWRKKGYRMYTSEEGMALPRQGEYLEAARLALLNFKASRKSGSGTVMPLAMAARYLHRECGLYSSVQSARSACHLLDGRHEFRVRLNEKGTWIIRFPIPKVEHNLTGYHEEDDD